jgi:hypothetical protein
MHQQTENIIEVSIETKTEGGLDKRKDAWMREGTAKHSEEKVDAGMDRAKDTIIKREVDTRAKKGGNDGTRFSLRGSGFLLFDVLEYGSPL